VSKIMLLAGFPRSGTTWFANLINAHPNVIYREKGFDHDSWKTVLTDAEQTVIKHHTSIIYDQIRQLTEGKSN
jgi:hypothetical protein